MLNHLTEPSSTCLSSVGTNSLNDGLESGSVSQHDVIVLYLETVNITHELLR
jgi:hypothetical protein